MHEICVVVPVYRCADCLPELHDRLTRSLRACTQDYEILFVDDRSPDAAWATMQRIASTDPATRLVRLSRNFGQHPAITAGHAQANARWVVVMDCDLQDPPEEIPRLYRKAREGFDIVLGRRVEKQHHWIRRLMARAYAGVVNFFGTVRADTAHGSFSIISRKVVDAFLQLQDRDRHDLFILKWLGVSTAEVEYAHAERFSGRSSYTLRALLRHAVSGIFFQTTVLLRWIVYLGLSVALAGVVLAGYFVYMYFSHDVYPGYTSLAVLILVVGGAIIVSTGVTGLYVGRIFEQVKGRPLYVIDEIRGTAGAGAPQAEENGPQGGPSDGSGGARS
jgi:dolichol-phosphate mannosyltransferase